MITSSNFDGDRKIGRLGASGDAIYIAGRTAIKIAGIDAVRQKSAAGHIVAVRINSGQTVLRRESDDPVAMNSVEDVRWHEQAAVGSRANVTMVRSISASSRIGLAVGITPNADATVSNDCK